MSLVISYLTIGLAIVAICNEFDLGARLNNAFAIGFKRDPFNHKFLTIFLMALIAILWPVWLLVVLVSVLRGEPPW